jgi:putative DNA-invertase from lambdoid prophage Rac
MKLLDRLERDDVLVVTKLDRLGRNTIDVVTTVQRLATRGVRVHCLVLGGVDLTSPAGPMRMSVIAAVAQFERDLLVERTQAGLDRARSPPLLSEWSTSSVGAGGRTSPHSEGRRPLALF